MPKRSFRARFDRLKVHKFIFHKIVSLPNITYLSSPVKNIATSLAIDIGFIRCLLRINCFRRILIVLYKSTDIFTVFTGFRVTYLKASFLSLILSTIVY